MLKNLPDLFEPCLIVFVTGLRPLVEGLEALCQLVFTLRLQCAGNQEDLREGQLYRDVP